MGALWARYGRSMGAVYHVWALYGRLWALVYGRSMGAVVRSMGAVVRSIDTEGEAVL